MTELFNPILKEFIIILCTGILTAFSSFLIALAKKGFDWISQKIELLKDEKSRKRLADYTERLHDIVQMTITSLQQTLGDDIRESLANNDGQYTREDLLNLKDIALASIKTQLTAAAYQALSEAYTDLDGLIGDMIELYLRNLKKSEE